MTFLKRLTPCVCFFVIFFHGELIAQKSLPHNIGDVISESKKWLFINQKTTKETLTFDEKIKAIITADTLKRKPVKKDSLNRLHPSDIKVVYNLIVKDQLALIKLINDNEPLRQLASINNDLQIVTGINFTTVDFGLKQLALNKPTQVFLKTSEGNLVLEWNENNKKVKVPLTSLRVLNATTAHLCWGNNTQRKLTIIDLANLKCQCPNNTSTKYQKMYKKNRLDWKGFGKL